MGSVDRRNKVLTALVVALFFTWPVAGQEPCASGSSDQCEGPLKEIGTAMFMRRGEPSQYVRGRKFLSHTHEVMPHRIQLENLGLENLSPKASMRRKMLQSQCSTTDNSNEAVLQCTNAVRTNPTAFEYPCQDSAQWLPPLTTQSRSPFMFDPLLASIANQQSVDQANMNRISHVGGDGSQLQNRVDGVGYNFRAVGENVAAGYESAEAVVMGWMCSPGHRKNIMSCDFGEIGIGGSYGNGRLFQTQDFGCEMGMNCGCGDFEEGPIAFEDEEEPDFDDVLPQRTAPQQQQEFIQVQPQQQQGFNPVQPQQQQGFNPVQPQQQQFQTSGSNLNDFFESNNFGGGTQSGFSNFQPADFVQNFRNRFSSSSGSGGFSTSFFQG